MENLTFDKADELRALRWLVSNDKRNKHLYVDKLNEKAIFDVIDRGTVFDNFGKVVQPGRVRKKFDLIIYRILNHQVTKEVFVQEKISGEIDDVYAIKIIVSTNIRIYCQMKSSESHAFLAMSEIVEHKDSQKLTERLKNVIRKVHKYEYDFEGTERV